MKYYILIVVGLVLCQAINAQFECVIEDDERVLTPLNEKSVYTPKVVRLNIHFMLRTNGKGNFTETGDNQGNSLTGYQFAKDLIEKCNLYQSYNPQMFLPPNNSTPNPAKKYDYVLEAVYFHRDDNLFNYRSITTVNYAIIGEHKDSVMNVFLSGDNVNQGYASSISHMSNIKYTEISNSYPRYVAFVNGVYPGDQYGWVLQQTTKTIVHEVGHLLT